MVEKENVNEKNLGSDVADGSASSLQENALAVEKEEKGREFFATEQAENGVEAENQAILGKFKSVDALTKAYGALEAAFTKKSQQLASMKEKVERLEKKAGVGVEKLRQNAHLRKLREKEFDVFLRELSGEKPSGEGQEGQAAADETKHKQGGQERLCASAPVEENFTEKAGRYELKEMKSRENLADRLDADLKNHQTERFERPFFSDGTGENARSLQGSLETKKESGCEQGEECVVRGKDTVLSYEDLYQAVKQNEEVRLKIVGEYLSSIGKSGAPISMGGMGTLAVPPKKAKTVNEAGGMALRYFKSTQAER